MQNERPLLPNLFIGSATEDFFHLMQDGDVIAIAKADAPEFIEALKEYLAHE